MYSAIPFHPKTHKSAPNLRSRYEYVAMIQSPLINQRTTRKSPFSITICPDQKTIHSTTAKSKSNLNLRILDSRSSGKLYRERRFDPQHVAPIVGVPVQLVVRDAEIKRPDNLGHDEAHLEMTQAIHQFNVNSLFFRLQRGVSFDLGGSIMGEGRPTFVQDIRDYRGRTADSLPCCRATRDQSTSPDDTRMVSQSCFRFWSRPKDSNRPRLPLAHTVRPPCLRG